MVTIDFRHSPLGLRDTDRRNLTALVSRESRANLARPVKGLNRNYDARPLGSYLSPKKPISYSID
jgi:hypothetical protein